MLGGNRREASRKRVSVIGLGRFGSSVARVCHELGYDVTVVDINEARVAEAADYATLAAQADGSDEEALLSLGVDRSEVAVVGQGQNIEQSISCTLVLKRIGVPWVIAKAETDIHGEIMTKVGADRIVFPESEAGDQVAHSLEIRHLVTYMNLSQSFGVARMRLPASAVQQTVGQIETSRPGVSIILIQRGDVLLPRPASDVVLQQGDFVSSLVLMKQSTRSRTTSALLSRARAHPPQSGGAPISSPPRINPESRANVRRHAQLFISGLVIISLVGTVFLALPWVTRSGQRTPVVDAFFTAVSAASVTGLSVVDPLEHWNWWGQAVLLLLTQIGGLGFMVGASILLQMLRRGAGAYTLRDELLLKDGAPALSIQEAVFLAGRIVRFTFMTEVIGAVLLAIWFGTAGGLRPLNALWNGLFYSVAAFCNAGFDLAGGFRSIRPAATDVWVNLVLMALIQLGAISYMVASDVARERSWRSLSIDSKIVLGLNGLLLTAGTVVFLAAEWGGALSEYATGSKLLASLFQSVSARSAGFSSIDWSLVNPLTLFFWLGLMLIGGASGSTSGGVRLNTVGVVLAAVASTLRGNAQTQLWGRRIATPVVFRAVTVIGLFLLIYGIGTVGLSIAEHHVGHRETGMIDLMFEAMSALGTVGVSTGVTPLLTAAGKLVLCALMLVGHLGPLIAVYALQRRHRPERYRFPEEAVRIG